MNLLIVIKFCEQFSWALSNFFADVSSKIITLANPALSQPDMLKQKWFLLRRRVYSLFAIYHVWSDLPAELLFRNLQVCNRSGEVG